MKNKKKKERKETYIIHIIASCSYRHTIFMLIYIYLATTTTRAQQMLATHIQIYIFKAFIIILLLLEDE